MKITDAYIVWKRHSADCWAVNHRLGRNSSFTIPDGHAFMNAYGMFVPSRIIRRRTGELQVVRTSPMKLVLGMLSLFRYIIVEDHVDAEAAHCAFLAIDEYREHITPYGHSYEQWFGGEDPPGWKPPR